MAKAKLKVAVETMVVGGKTIRAGQTYDPNLLSKGDDEKKADTE